MSEPLDPRISDWLDGALGADEEAELLAWAGQDPARMQQLVEASLREQMLREVVQAEFTAGEVRERNRKVTQMPNRWLAPVTAAAAVFVALALMIWSESGGGVRAQVTMTSETQGFELGDSLRLQRLRLEEGTLGLELASDVRVQFFGPVEAEFIDGMRLRLLDGRISAEVGARGKGFTVITDAGEVIDLGTEFGVEATRGGEARVAVFRGSVEVRPNEGGTPRKDPILLTEGQAARFSALAGLRRWQQVALAAEAAGLASRNYAGVIKSVSDNQGDEDLHPFYGVVSGGMREGALAFTDKPNPRWQVAQDQPFPSWLEGADVVRTYHQFRNRRNYELRLDLEGEATVYVLYDAGQTPPSWLEAEFEKTAARLRVGPWHPGMLQARTVIEDAGEPWLEMAVWKRETGPGEVILGSPRASREQPTPVMYGLMVKPR